MLLLPIRYTILYYFLGGDAESEKLEREIDRECQEEIFYSIKNIRELIRVGEFRNIGAEKYETICFFAEINKKPT